MQVLIAHRDAAVRAALAQAVAAGQGPDLDVIESGSGEEALGLLLGDHAPHLAVIDWDLPGIDGPEICRLARDFSTNSPPYLVLLADSHHPDIEAGLQAGANECIHMPERAADIRECIDAGGRFISSRFSRDPGVATLEAVRSPDPDNDMWAAPQAHGTPAGLDARAGAYGKVELKAVLSRC
jgi:CheY-like chemotaxis protein